MLTYGRLTPAYLHRFSLRKTKQTCLEHVCHADIAKIQLVERPEAADDGVALRAAQRLFPAVHKIQEFEPETS